MWSRLHIYRKEFTHTKRTSHTRGGLHVHLLVVMGMVEWARQLEEHWSLTEHGGSRSLISDPCQYEASWFRN